MEAIRFSGMVKFPDMTILKLQKSLYQGIFIPKKYLKIGIFCFSACLFLCTVQIKHSFIMKFKYILLFIFLLVLPYAISGHIRDVDSNLPKAWLHA
jgi:hypothetical protein